MVRYLLFNFINAHRTSVFILSSMVWCGVPNISFPFLSLRSWIVFCSKLQTVVTSRKSEGCLSLPCLLQVFELLFTSVQWCTTLFHFIGICKKVLYYECRKEIQWTINMNVRPLVPIHLIVYTIYISVFQWKIVGYLFWRL